MPTDIRLTRRPGFAKSDALREDTTLSGEVQKLGAWLATRDIDLVTMAQVLTHARAGHPDATLARDPIEYAWVWDPIRKLWYLECYDRGTIAFVPEGEDSSILMRVTITAKY